MTRPTHRRRFLEQLGTASVAALGAGTLPLASALAGPAPEGAAWDMSWLERLTSSSYRAVIDASTLEEGYAADLASALMNDFRDVHAATDDQVRIVIVARRLGTPLVLGDALWEKYPIGEDSKMNDGDGKPYRRNPFYRPRAGASADGAATKLETLQRRGVTLLVCNIAANNWARRMAQTVKADPEQVRKDVFANFVPGTIVQPSGVFAIMRAQNAGCAFMRGQ